MRMKTTTQQLIEARNPGKDIREIILEVMGSRQGQKNIVSKTATDMEISDSTLYHWCRELGISTDDYLRTQKGEEP